MAKIEKILDDFRRNPGGQRYGDFETVIKHYGGTIRMASSHGTVKFPGPDGPRFVFAKRREMHPKAIKDLLMALMEMEVINDQA